MCACNVCLASPAAEPDDEPSLLAASLAVAVAFKASPNKDEDESMY